MARWLPAELRCWINRMSQPLHARLADRLLTFFVGLLLARGRRTVSSWLVAADVGHAFQLHYYFLISLGRKVKWVAGVLVRIVAERLADTLGRFVFALDDSPTKRFGPKVEGAGIHHNPTPGPSDQKFLYGHVWVTLSWVVRHPLWGAIGLPLWALLYVRAKDIDKLPARYGVTFRTKLEMAVELMEWLVLWLNDLGKRIWIVADGAYAKKTFLRRAVEMGVTVVSRLRHDAALRTLPEAPRPGQRGRPRKYGKRAISLAKRAAHARGWTTGEFMLYGECMEKTYKTFLASYAPVGGVIRVVLVKEADSWVAFFCTDPNATVTEILEAVGDRAAIEQDFHDIKEVHGAGEQQVRNYWSNIATYHLTLWWHTLVELWAWEEPTEKLVDRSARPWDDAARRPSHRDRCNSLRRQCLEAEFSQLEQERQLPRKCRLMFERVLGMVA